MDPISRRSSGTREPSSPGPMPKVPPVYSTNRRGPSGPIWPSTSTPVIGQPPIPSEACRVTAGRPSPISSIRSAPSCVLLLVRVKSRSSHAAGTGRPSSAAAWVLYARPVEEDFLLFAGSASQRLGPGDRRIPRPRRWARPRRCDSPRATSSSGSWRTSEAETCSSSRAPPSRPTTTSWSCSSGSTRSSARAPRRSPPSSRTSATPRATRRTSPGSRSAPGSAPTPSRRPAPTGSSRWTSTRRSCRGSSGSRSTTSTRCRCCATPSQPRSRDDLVVVSPDAGFAKKARQWADRLARPVGHRRQATRRPRRVGGDHRAHRVGRGSHGAHRR